MEAVIATSTFTKWQEMKTKQHLGLSSWFAGKIAHQLLRENQILDKEQDNWIKESRLWSSALSPKVAKIFLADPSAIPEEIKERGLAVKNFLDEFGFLNWGEFTKTKMLQELQDIQANEGTVRFFTNISDKIAVERLQFECGSKYIKRSAFLIHEWLLSTSSEEFENKYKRNFSVISVPQVK